MAACDSGKKVYCFTRVELLVVIAILFIIAGLVVPACNRARERARESACGNNLRQFGSANTMYAGDHDGFSVPGVIATPSTITWAQSGVTWVSLLGKYLHSKGPAAQPEESLYQEARDFKLAGCPATPERFGYGHNSYYLGTLSGRGSSDPYLNRAWKLGQFMKAAQTIFTTDNYRPLKNELANRQFTGWNPSLAPGSHGYKNDQSSIYSIHLDKGNILWLDNHLSPAFSNTFAELYDMENNEVDYAFWGRIDLAGTL